MSTPASSGPTMTPACRTVIDSALAAGTPSGPTSAGMTAPRVGWLTAANPETDAVSTHSTARLPSPGSAACTASSALVTADPAEVMSISRRRSMASAIAPPSRPNTISGISATIDVTPTSSDEWVTRKTWKGTATSVICWPSMVAAIPPNSRR
jgi:hypothetical protein